ncbi:BtrH N-terminal domain-containing protein [Jongsikchunia kroppenstedtii]|uniref:BtrH N-terminal domain-containing protein n=1 Tax=Jongsikchunia kroppenstedtii TaxID=1121721 RepID=UPI0003A6A5B1|nr:BtrH N-terminal domain-containing protein [Jongsikchunia kroppenstedtii]
MPVYGSSAIDMYPHRMGGHCGSGAMRDLLEWNGLGYGGPPDEGLVFALGGALSLTYVRSDALTPPVYLVGRGPDFEVDLPRRLGGAVEVVSTDDPEHGWAILREEIDCGRPALVWAEIAELPYLRVQLRMSRHDIVIVGYDDEAGIAFVADNDRAELQQVPLEALARARRSTSFPEPTRHSLFRINWPRTLPSLSAVAAEAFAQSASNLRVPTGSTIAGPAAQGSHGLEAASTLASDVATWGTLADDELEVHLFSLGAFIEKAGTGGGLFRYLLAKGCDEIARLTGDRATADLAIDAHRAAAAWTAVARVAVQKGLTATTLHAEVVKAAAVLPKVEANLAASLHSAAESLKSA